MIAGWTATSPLVVCLALTSAASANSSTQAESDAPQDDLAGSAIEPEQASAAPDGLHFSTDTPATNNTPFTFQPPAVNTMAAVSDQQTTLPARSSLSRVSEDTVASPSAEFRFQPPVAVAPPSFAVPPSSNGGAIETQISQSPTYPSVAPAPLLVPAAPAPGAATSLPPAPVYGQLPAPAAYPPSVAYPYPTAYPPQLPTGPTAYPYPPQLPTALPAYPYPPQIAAPTAYPYPPQTPIPAPTAYPYPPGVPTAYPYPYSYPYPSPAPAAYPYPPAPQFGYPYPAPAPSIAYPTAPTAPGYPAPSAIAPPAAGPLGGATAPIAPSTAATPTVPSVSGSTAQQPVFNSSALTSPSLRLQGVYVLQGDESSARARLSGVYPLTPNLLFGGSLDLTDGDAFSDSQTEGLSLNELYLAASLPDLPNLRFVVGQLDLTSYFDRNSFAKDGASQFFNPVFQTNPALTAAAIGSRPGLLINWSLNDNIEARAAAFSSDRSISDFQLDGFAGEVGLRFGNAIVRGTYTSGRDGGSNSGFSQIFQIDRGNGQTGLQEDDREESYGVNAELFIPELNLGLFGRYGHYENQDLGEGADTYSAGLTFLDVFSQFDRLGLAYGRGLSNERLRRQQDELTSDVLELYYDFRVLPNLRLGFTVQQLDEFSETIAGFRIRSEFDVTPRR